LPPGSALVYYGWIDYCLGMRTKPQNPIFITPTNLPEIIGQCPIHTSRAGKDMSGYYLVEPEPSRLIYEVHELETTGHMKLALTVMRPGKVGNEFHMTKGHFHEYESAGEVYYCLKGRGLILMQTRDDETAEIWMGPGAVAHIPPGWAHRSVNVGDEELMLLAIYPRTAGHDYAGIEERGFLKRAVEENGKAILLEK
jgi:glucose-6-phosphate isomerase